MVIRCYDNKCFSPNMYIIVDIRSNNGVKRTSVLPLKINFSLMTSQENMNNQKRNGRAVIKHRKTIY